MFQGWESAAVKDTRYQTKMEVNQFTKLLQMFQLQKEQIPLQKNEQKNESKNEQECENMFTSRYLKVRNNARKHVFRLASRFYQSDETKHLAVDLFDRYYAHCCSSQREQENEVDLLSTRQLLIHSATCLILASKQEELDTNIVLSEDLIEHLTRLAEAADKDKAEESNRIADVPKQQDIWACETKLLTHF